ncbi:MAG: glycosyltransferase [Deltaproteobacteria bacterium]|nr:glycosyltransferase [Deltaproteobacteria bacterium]
MNVVFLEASSGSVVGGSLSGMLELLRGLDRRRISPFVVLYEHKPSTADLVAQGVPVRVFDKRRLPKQHGLEHSASYAKAKQIGAVGALMRGARALATFLVETVPAALRLARLVREARPDLIYVCNGFRGNADAIVAARILRVPCVVHAKGFDKFTFVERMLSRRVALCVSMTKAIEHHCRRGGMRPGAFTVVYDGLDLGAFRPARGAGEVREELAVAADAEVVGVVGNIQQWKGQRVLVDAIDLLRERRPRLVAWLVGGVHRSGLAYAEALRAHLRERGLERRVWLTGSRNDVPDLMAAMDIVVHTSVRGEPFGRVIIEAMAVGRPVIATRAGGVPEFVHEGRDALLTTPGDAAELATAIDRLLGDAGERARLAAAALESVQRFRLDRHVETMCALFEGVAAGRRGRDLVGAVEGAA